MKTAKVLQSTCFGLHPCRTSLAGGVHVKKHPTLYRYPGQPRRRPHLARRTHHRTPQNPPGENRFPGTEWGFTQV